MLFYYLYILVRKMSIFIQFGPYLKKIFLFAIVILCEYRVDLWWEVLVALNHYYSAGLFLNLNILKSENEPVYWKVFFFLNPKVPRLRYPYERRLLMSPVFVGLHAKRDEYEKSPEWEKMSFACSLRKSSLSCYGYSELQSHGDVRMVLVRTTRATLILYIK